MKWPKNQNFTRSMIMKDYKSLKMKITSDQLTRLPIDDII